jgi:hypothetical protein
VYFRAQNARSQVQAPSFFLSLNFCDMFLSFRLSASKLRFEASKGCQGKKRKKETVRNIKLP